MQPLASKPAARPLPSPVAQLGLKLEVAYCVGGVISPLLANIYLNDLDHQMAQAEVAMERYADDCAPRRREEEANVAP